MWKTNSLEVFLSLTNFCNAKCPQCNRTDRNTLEAHKLLPMISWSLEDFEKAFPADLFKHISLIKFCGTLGDPMMCKDIYEIAEYVINTNNTTHIAFNTNGSLRSDDFWWSFGVMGGKRMRVTFDIDGITQEMHSKYRIGTDLEKILSNMETFSMTGAITRTQTIVFKHNQDYLDKIKTLCIKYGSTYHSHELSTRFVNDKDGKPIPFYYGTDNDYLEKGTFKNTDKIYTSAGNLDAKEVNSCITCLWAKDNLIAVNPDGQVFPCCYIATRYYEGERGISHKVDFDHPTIFRYNKNDNNLFTKNLIDIVKKGEYLNDILPNNIANNPYSACIKHCSSIGGTSNVAVKVQ